MSSLSPSVGDALPPHSFLKGKGHPKSQRPLSSGM